MSDASPSEPSPANEAPAPAKTSGAAIASLVLGLLGMCLWFLTAVPAIILGIVALVNISRSGGRLKGSGLAIAGLVIAGLSMLCLPILALPGIQAVREAARRSQSMNNMRQISLATFTYESLKNSLPAAGVNEQGEGPALSWRVHILPYLEQQDLYDQFHLDEPWDSEHNRRLIDQMPAVYRNPNAGMKPFETNYLALTGPQAAFPGGPTGPALSDIADGESNTMIIVEADADQAVIWTRPDDLVFDPNNPRRGLGSYRPGGFPALFADSHLQFIPGKLDDETISALITRAGGESVSPGDLYIR